MTDLRTITMLFLFMALSGWTKTVTLELSNGKSFTGIVESENERFFILNSEGTSVRILKRIVHRLNGEPYVNQAVAPQTAVTTPQTTTIKQSSDTVPVPTVPLVPPPAPATDTTDIFARGSQLTIKLKNGTSFEGTVLEATTNFVTFDIGGSRVNILKAIIVRALGKDSDTKPAIAPVQASPSVSADTGSFVVQPPATPKPLTPALATTADTDSDTEKYGPQAPLTTTDTAQHLSTFNEPTASSTPTNSKTGTPAEQDKSAFQSPIESVRTALDDKTAKLVRDLYTKDPVRQIRACRGLAQRGSEAARAIPNLIDMFSYSSPYTPSRREMRKGASENLAGTSPATSAEKALCAIGQPSVAPLVQTLTNKNPDFRAHAAAALGELRDTLTVDALTATLRDSSALVREAGARAVGKIRDPRTIPMLITLLSEDTTTAVQMATQQSLTELTDLGELIAGLRDPHPVVRANSLYILWLMTQKEFKNDVDAWEQWWKDRQKSTSEPSGTSASSSGAQK